MELSLESVAAYTVVLKDPKSQNLPIRPLSECFKDADVATPKHLLFKDYQQEVGSNVPKVIFYIVMDGEYANKIAKAPNGDLGYLLEFVPKVEEPDSNPESNGAIATETK